MSLKKGNKIAVITGGSRGIGFSIAKILAKEKYNIVICSRNENELMKAKLKLEEFGVTCLALKVDVSDFRHCYNLVKKTIEKFSRIDLLVNNAGIQGPIGSLWKNGLKDWEKTIRINLLGTFYMCHFVIPYMLKQKSGKIINFSGGGSVYARPLFSAYACSKAAILRLTDTLQEELKGKNIFVHAIAPGTVWTQMAMEALKAKRKKLLNKETIYELKLAQKTGGTPISKFEKLIKYLITRDSKILAGRLIHVNELDDLLKKKTKIKEDGGKLRRITYT